MDIPNPEPNYQSLPPESAPVSDTKTPGWAVAVYTGLFLIVVAAIVSEFVK
jgi:hypothetical protein